MSENEPLPPELIDCQRMLASLAPRASRIDRDRLMLRLGQQSATRGTTPWKWATAASLLLAVGLGLRTAYVSQEVAPAQLAIQSPATAPRSIPPQTSSSPAASDAAPHPAVPPLDPRGDWQWTVASGEFSASRTLSVRPQWKAGEFAAHGSEPFALEDSALDESATANPVNRSPMLRWSDRPLRRDTADPTAPPTT